MNKLEIKAVPDNLPTVLDFIDKQLDAAGCPVKVKMQIDIAVEEIFVNIAHYAYAPDVGMAEISFSIEDGAAVARFKDSGVPYDPLAKPDPDITLSAKERQIGGLGIFMVKKIMDDVRYEFLDGCNILTLRKGLVIE